MTPPQDGIPMDAFGDIDFDLQAVLDRDSRILLDPHFLGALHAELHDELGDEDAAVALFQMGFLHGLQDAVRALATNGVQTPGAIVPPLRMRCRTIPGDLPGEIRVVGSWPERSEAASRLATLGADGHAACHLSAGYTSGWLSGTLDVDLVAVETQCGARGESECAFVARECAAWRDDGDPRVAGLLEMVPFGLFRATVHERESRGGAPAAPQARDGGFERDAPLVHIWGPVMVIPFAGPEEALSALELIGRDPGAADVSVVVIDLSGAIVDEAFGALALEQIVQTVEAWGAEAIFAEPSTISEPVVTDLDHPPLLIQKDLDHAIAAAFQIARSQRRLM